MRLASSPRVVLVTRTRCLLLCTSIWALLFTIYYTADSWFITPNKAIPVNLPPSIRPENQDSHRLKEEEREQHPPPSIDRVNFDDDDVYCAASLPPANLHSEYLRQYPGSELLQVYVFHRHGDRSPLHLLPDEANRGPTWDECTDAESRAFGDDGLALEREIVIPNTSRSIDMWKGNCFMGQLTNKGAIQLKELGERLRQIYIQGLAPILESRLTASNSMYIRTTDTQRTHHSVARLLEGMYPPGERDAGLIKVHVHANKVDSLHISSVQAACPRLQEIMSNVFPNMTRWKDYRAAISKNMTIIAEKIGIAEEDLDRTRIVPGRIADVIRCRSCHQKPLPCSPSGPCLNVEEKRLIFEWREWEYSFWFRENGSQVATEFNTLLAGPFFREWSTGLAKVNESEGGDYPKMNIFSAHDSTLQVMLSALGSKDIKWPPYRSNLIAEVWQEEGLKYVRLVYNGKTVETDWCDFERCEFEAFQRRLGDYIAEDYRSACVEQL